MDCRKRNYFLSSHFLSFRMRNAASGKHQFYSRPEKINSFLSRIVSIGSRIWDSLSFISLHLCFYEVLLLFIFVVVIKEGFIDIFQYIFFVTQILPLKRKGKICELFFFSENIPEEILTFYGKQVGVLMK